MTTLEEIISKTKPYFDYVFETLKQKYGVEIRWEIDVRPKERSSIYLGERIVRETFELKIFIIGKTTIIADGIIRYYIEVEKTRRKEYVGFRLASIEEIEEKIKTYL